MNSLLSSITINSTTYPNRVVMAPMTRNRAPEGIPTALMAEYYGQRASAGLIITEGAQISQQAVGYPATPGIYNDAHIIGWQSVTQAVHQKGGHIFCQLWHCGRISHPDYHEGELPVAPSAVRPHGQAFTYQGLKDFITPRALKLEEIPYIIEQYRHAAACAIQAGFDGVEIHAANGYLLDQFLRSGSNKRDDIYGGSIENRARLLQEVCAAVCNEIGAENVGIRISPVNTFNDIHDADPQNLFNHVANMLSAMKPNYLHVVEVDLTGNADTSVDMQQIHQNFNGHYIANGSYTKERGDSTIATGDADMVAYGVPYLANPDLVERFQKNSPLNQADQSTFYGGDEHGYTDYPSLTAVNTAI